MSTTYADLGNRDWQVKVVSNLAGGINAAAPEHEIDDSETPNSENLRFRHGRAVVDTGYSGVGTNAMRGTTKGLFTHQRANGITTVLAVTDLSVYEFSNAKSAWHYTRSAVGTTVSTNEIVAATLIDVANTAGFAAGNFIGIELNDGVQHQTTIVAIPTPGAPGVIQIAAGLPSAASIGRLFIKAVVLAGTDSQQVVFAALPSHEWTVFTNGVDVPQRYDGTDCRPIPNLPSAGSIVCRTLVVYKDAYLILYGLVDAGVASPYKMIWCTAGDPTNWSTGDSGGNALVDSRDSIVAVQPLLDALVIYRSSSIVLQEYVGLPWQTFRWTAVNFGRSISSEGVGCVSPNGVFGFTDVHLVIGRNRIYTYRGGDRTDTISHKIFKHTFGVGGRFNRGKMTRAFTFYDEVNDEVYFGAPGSGVFPTSFAVMDASTGSWRLRRMAHEITCAGIRPVTATDIIRIVDLVGTIAEQSWIIGGGGVPEGAGIIMLGQVDTPVATGYVVDYDLVTPNDDGVAISWFIETKAFRGHDRYARCDFIEVEATGPLFVIQRYQAKVGLFTTVKMTSATAGKKRERANKQFVEEALRFRLVGSTSGNELSTLAFKFRSESRWAL